MQKYRKNVTYRPYDKPIIMLGFAQHHVKSCSETKISPYLALGYHYKEAENGYIIVNILT